MLLNQKSGFTSSQLFIYLVALIILTATLLFGYNIIGGTYKNGHQADMLYFKTQLKSDIGQMSKDFGSVRQAKYKLPSGFDEICFAGTTKTDELPEYFVHQHPLAANSVEAGNNAFLIGKKDSDSFEIEKLGIKTKAICIPGDDNGMIELKMVGKENMAVIDTAVPLNVDVNVPAGSTEDDIVVVFPDYSAKLKIPAGTEVHYPAGSEEQITVNKVSDVSLPDQLTAAGSVYDFKPDGTTFDHQIPLTLSYNPNKVSDPSLLMIYFFDGSDWAVLDSSFDVDTRMHTITGYANHFTMFAVAEDNNIKFISETKPVTYLAGQINGNAADPYILKGIDKYYLYFTGNNNFPIYESTDFITWHYVGKSFLNNNFNTPGKKKWEDLEMNADYGYYYLWAPEVMHIGNYYIMTFTGFQIPNSESNHDYFYLNDKYSMTLWAATSTSPTGPFGPANGQRMHEPVPIRSYRWGFNKNLPHSEVYHPGCPNNDNPGDPVDHNPLSGPCITPMKLDSNYFVDDDGSIWFTYSWFGQTAGNYPNTQDQGQHLAMVKLDSVDLTLTSQGSPEYYRLTNSWDSLQDYKSGKDMHMCIFGKNKGISNSELVNGKKLCINEAPEIIKQNNKYYLFYSANVFDSNAYSIYYKMADSLRCLAYGRESDSSCNVKQGIAFDGLAGGSDYTYGHGTIVKGPGGILYHVITVMKKSDTSKSYRKLWVVKQEFNDDGTPKTVAPDITDYVEIRRKKDHDEGSNLDCVSIITQHPNDAQNIPGFVENCKTLLLPCVGCSGTYSNKIVFPAKSGDGSHYEPNPRWCPGTFSLNLAGSNWETTCPQPSPVIGCDVVNALNPNLQCPQNAPPCIPDCTCSSDTCTGQTCANGCGGTCNGLKDCNQCIPDCSCASDTCTGQVCSDGCDGTCAGTKSCMTYNDCVNIITQHPNDAQNIPGFVENCKTLLLPCVGCSGTYSNKIVFPAKSGDGSNYEPNPRWCPGTFSLNLAGSNWETTCPQPSPVVGCGVVTALNPALQCPQSQSCITDCSCAQNTCLGQFCDGGCGMVCQGLKDCNQCIPDCSCASDTCTGQICSDGCGGTCAGTKSCDCTCSCSVETCQGSNCVNDCGGHCAGTKIC